MTQKKYGSRILFLPTFITPDNISTYAGNSTDLYINKNPVDIIIIPNNNLEGVVSQSISFIIASKITDLIYRNEYERLDLVSSLRVENIQNYLRNHCITCQYTPKKNKKNETLVCISKYKVIETLKQNKYLVTCFLEN